MSQLTHFSIAVTIVIAVSSSIGCTSSPTAPSPDAGAGVAIAPAGEPVALRNRARSWGPELPSFNLEVVLRGDGFGLVKFRQPNDDALVILLDTWVRGLAPNSGYLLQRAVDPTVDDNCTSTAWLTLGKGPQPHSISTDATGTGREELFRSVSAFAVGTEFDIHFRVIDEATSAVALTSECYQFRISQ